MTQPAVLKDMLTRMYRIRYFEEGLKKFYSYSGYYPINSAVAAAKTADDLLTCVSYDFDSSGLIGGAVHLYIGEEAVAVGVCTNLTDADSMIISPARTAATDTPSPRAPTCGGCSPS